MDCVFFPFQYASYFTIRKIDLIHSAQQDIDPKVVCVRTKSVTIGYNFHFSPDTHKLFDSTQSLVAQEEQSLTPMTD